MRPLILSPSNGVRLPVGMLYCAGRNYAAHATEMGAEVPTDRPIMFMKPSVVAAQHGAIIARPAYSEEMHFEGEIVVIIGTDASSVSESEALAVVAGYSVGIDLTLRDLQLEAKRRGEPWMLAKVFPQSAPLAEPVAIDDPRLTPHAPLEIRLHVNGALMQVGNTLQLVHSIPKLIAYLFSIVPLRAGDCTFTGTPENVGPLHSGDSVRAEL